MGLFSLFRKKKPVVQLSGKDLLWEQFIDEIWPKDFSELNDVQKNAVLCFGYDAEVQNGGHGQYFDTYAAGEESGLLADALAAVAGKDMAENYLRALTEGEQDGWAAADGAYYAFSPSLTDYLADYIEKHKDDLFA